MITLIKNLLCLFNDLWLKNYNYYIKIYKDFFPVFIYYTYFNNFRRIKWMIDLINILLYFIREKQTPFISPYFEYVRPFKIYNKKTINMINRFCYFIKDNKVYYYDFSD